MDSKLSVLVSSFLNSNEVGIMDGVGMGSGMVFQRDRRAK
jgi:hypothetical protein